MIEMESRRIAIFVSLTMLSATAVADDAPPRYLAPELVELPIQVEETLLAAPHTVINEAPSDALRTALEARAVDEIRVEKIRPPPAQENDGRSGGYTAITYQAWIHYTPVKQSASRVYKPVVLCIGDGDPIEWKFCQDESWLRLQTPAMKKPIRFNGDLTDEDVDRIFEFVDDAGLVDVTDNRPITTDLIFEIIKYPHVGNRINVYVGDGDNFGETFYLRHTDAPAGESQFELTTFTCGGAVRGRSIVQIAAVTAATVTDCSAGR